MAYKLAVFEILRDFVFVVAYITHPCYPYIIIESTDSMILGADWACPNVNPHELLNKLDVNVAPKLKAFWWGLYFHNT